MSDDVGAAEAAGLPKFDTHAVIAKLRKGDDEAMGQAYRIVFETELGRLVLAHLAAEAGVGRKFGAPDLSPASLAYHQGGHDVALEIMERAGFDPSSAVLMVMTGHLEGRDDEASAYAEPDPPMDDDD